MSSSMAASSQVSYMTQDEKLAFENFKSKVKTTLDEENEPGYCESIRAAKLTQICLARWAKLKPEERKVFYPAPPAGT